MLRRKRVLVSVSVMAVILVVIFLLAWSRGFGQGTGGLSTGSQSARGSSSTPKIHTYSSVVHVTLTSVHSSNRPRDKIQFVLSVRPLKFVPNSTNSGQGTFRSSGIPHLVIVGQLVSNKSQIGRDIYVYKLKIPPSWQKSQHDPLYILANYALVSDSQPGVTEGYSTLYQVLNPIS